MTKWENRLLEVTLRSFVYVFRIFAGISHVEKHLNKFFLSHSSNFLPLFDSQFSYVIFLFKISMIKILIQSVTYCTAAHCTQNPSFRKIITGKLENEAGNVENCPKDNRKRAVTANNISKAEQFGWIVYLTHW